MLARRQNPSQPLLDRLKVCLRFGFEFDVLLKWLDASMLERK
jgi:hypothetical protein